MIKGIDHVGIAVRDYETMTAWYRDTFRMTVFSHSPEKCFLGFADGSMIELYPMDEDAPVCSNRVRGVRHPALIPEDYDEAMARLKALGITGEEGEGVIRMFFFQDPEGNVIQLIER